MSLLIVGVVLFLMFWLLENDDDDPWSGYA